MADPKVLQLVLLLLAVATEEEPVIEQG